eukprot:3605653-Rhodomonas_salina.1
MASRSDSEPSERGATSSMSAQCELMRLCMPSPKRLKQHLTLCSCTSAPTRSSSNPSSAAPPCAPSTHAATTRSTAEGSS